MRRKLRRAAMALLVVLGLGATGLMCQRVSDRGRYVASHSTYGSGPEGTRGAFLLAEQLGARPTRWVQDFGALDGGGMLVATGSCQQVRRPLGRLDRERMRDWVEEGGVLVVAGADGYLDDFPVRLNTDETLCRPTRGILGAIARAEDRRNLRKQESDPEEPPDDLSRVIGEELSDDEESDEEHEIVPRLVVGSHGPFEGMPPLGLRIRSQVEVDPEVPHEALLRLDGPNGRPVAVRVEVGEGSVIVLASASVLQNRDLANQGGGVFFARLVREYADGGPVYFDEYHLGIGARRSLMRFITELGGGALVLQLLFLALLALWRSGSRFGGVRDAPASVPAGTASYVDGVGALYAKAKDAPGAAAILLRRGLRRVASHHHFGAMSADRLCHQLEAVGKGPLAQRVRALVESKVEKRKLAAFGKELDGVLEEALAERSGS